MKFNKARLSGFQAGMDRCRIIYSVILLSATLYAKPAQAQELWGTDPGDGGTAGGIFRFITQSSEQNLYVPLPSGGTNNTEYSYTDLYHYRLVKASNGKFYGFSLDGGSGGEGVLFEFDPITRSVSSRTHFNYYGDGRPLGNLQEYNGKLYGAIDGLGRAVFSYNLATREFKHEVIIPSVCTELVLVDGKFYGMTYNGGTKWAGAIFRFDPQSSAYTVLFQFDHYQTGRYPRAGLTYLNGKLYGLMASGGKYGQGTLIEYTLATGEFRKTIDFHRNINGSVPVGNLTLYNGKLFGVTESGGANDLGILFEYDPITQTLRKLLDYNNASQGRFFQNIGGTLYGLSTTGGIHNKGSLFSLDPSTGQLTELFDFSDEFGSAPFGILAQDGDYLWGMTKYGGSDNGGIFFRYNTLTHEVTNQGSVAYGIYGKRLTALVQANDKFYGITGAGGEFGRGTIVKFDPATSELSAVHHFSCEHCFENFYGISPYEGALLVHKNKLYGITMTQSTGELFSYDLLTGKYARLHEFNPSGGGVMPVGQLTLLNGKLYGTTRVGEWYAAGTLFEYDLATSTYSVKMRLGLNVVGSNVRLTATNNAIYGVSDNTLTGNGMLIQYDPVANTSTVKYTFQSSADGRKPKGALLWKGGKLYGQLTGGTNYSDRIFSFDIATNQVEILSHNFSRAGVLFEVDDTKLYAGGSSGYITRFNLQTRTSSEEYFGWFDFIGGVNSLFIKEACSSESVITEVVDFSQGLRKDLQPVAVEKSIPENALFIADNFDYNRSTIGFTTLGFGGSITLSFDHPLCDTEGSDFQVIETSYGNPSFYHNPEQAELFVSKDGATWFSVGVSNPAEPSVQCSAKMDAEFDIQTSGLDWVKYVKVRDISNPLAKRREANTCLPNGPYAFNDAADGFDLDAIESKAVSSTLSSARMAARASALDVVDVEPAQARGGLYPNPAITTVTIDLSQEEEMVLFEDHADVEVMDLNGRLLNQKSGSVNDWKIIHDVSELKPGLYIARVKNGNVRRHYKFLKE